MKDFWKKITFDLIYYSHNKNLGEEYKNYVDF